jgi:hypothetical protein
VNGESVPFGDLTPDTEYTFYFTTESGEVSEPFTIVSGNCGGEVETICDCAGTVHTIGVLEWIGDGFADAGEYDWEGQFVDFNCATWGYDCGDIAGAPADDPYAVCSGNLPPNNGCIIEESCQPLALDFENIPCEDNGNGLLPGVNIIFSIGGNCVASELCVVANNEELCFYLPDYDLFPVDGDSVPFIDLTPDTEYTFYFTTESGEVSEPFTIVSGNCGGEVETICDCAGTVHTIGVLEWIGDGFADAGEYEWEGQFVDFNCATWGYDCGDIAGAPADDPYAVCSGNLPPNNGCESEVETICDCTGTEHTIGVLEWIGDGFADAGEYEWEGQPVNFNCATWGYDCGDIAGAPADDPYGVCLGNLPPLNGCLAGDVLGCTDSDALNYNEDATIDDGSCLYECVLPVIAFTPNCDGINTEEFYILISVSNAGNAVPYVVTNNVNASNISIPGAGNYEIGPFPNNSNVIVTVSSTELDNCSVTSTSLTEDCTSVVNISETEAAVWSVYPNPGDGNLTLVNSAGSQARAIDIFDAAGRLLFSVEPEQISGNDTRIELKGRLTAGSYFLRVLHDQSQTTLPILILE